MAQRMLLVDGDIVAYQIAARNEQKFVFGDDELWDADIPAALEEAFEYLEELQDDLAADRLVVALSCATGRYFRHDVFEPYKSNRSGRRPEALGAIKGAWEGAYEVVRRPALEADDVMGILATADLKKYEAKEKVIVTIDKDLDQIPGLHAHLAEREIYEVSGDIGQQTFYHQTITGDSTDGYPGIFRAGPVAAEKLLGEYWHEGEEVVWEKMEELAAAKGHEPDHLLSQARCAKILQAQDYDFKKKKAILWEPPSE